jgi:type IV fimbrial biogenesis protein FimT
MEPAMSLPPPRGVTLVELVFTLALATLLLLLATRAVDSGLEAARSEQARSHLLASLTLAASRAALTGRHAVVCPSRDGASCAASVDWSGGWIVFLDVDADGIADAGERRLDRVGALGGRVRLRTSTGRRRVTFQGSGGNAGSNLTFTLCDGRGPARARSLVLANSGGLRDAPAGAAAAAATCPG